MTARTDLIAWLHSISGSYILTGQTAHSDGDHIDENTRVLGFRLAIEFYDPWLDRLDFDDAFFERSMRHFDAGGMVGIHMSMLPNPITGDHRFDGIDPDNMVVWDHPQNLALRRSLDQMGGLLRRYQSRTPKPVFFRPYSEMDGWWVWWGPDILSPQQFIALYRFTYAYLTSVWNLDNLLWTFAANGGPGTYLDRYPGDDVVDIVGMEAYTNNLDADCWQTYLALRALAPSKLFALTERGSGNPGGCDPNFDARRLFADIRQFMPAIVYVNWWSGWGPSGEQNAVEALTAPYVLNRP